MRTVDKAFAYVTRGDLLLVFRHPSSPEAGIQVPAGTVESNESPRRAVLREAREETGLTDLVFQDALGQVLFDMSPFGRREMQRRHFFHLRTSFTEATWRHREQHPSGGEQAPIEFEFFWVPLNSPPELIAGHGELLHVLTSSTAARASSVREEAS